MGLERTAHIDTIAGQPVFKLEENVGVAFDDHIVEAGYPSLNDVPVKVFGERVIANGVLSNREIKVAHALGHIVIDPYNPDFVNTSSVDVTMGHYYYDTGRDNEGLISLFNPYSEQQTERFFGEVQEARPLEEMIRSLGEKGLEIANRLDCLEEYPKDHPVIPLFPHQRILAHTNEFIGILPPGTSSMQTRSSWGRAGGASCFCSGWGDSGYTNRWTMEFYNLNHSAAMLIPEGARVAQLVFQSTGPVAGEYASDTGKYQASTGSNLDELKLNWRYTSMKPRIFKDAIRPLVPVTGLAEGIR